MFIANLFLRLSSRPQFCSSSKIGEITVSNIAAVVVGVVVVAVVVGVVHTFLFVLPD